MFDNTVTGYLVRCVNDIKKLLSWVISAKETTYGNITDDKRLLLNLMEPTIEFITKCIFKDATRVCNGFLCGNNTCLKQYMLQDLICFGIGS